MKIDPSKLKVGLALFQAGSLPAVFLSDHRVEFSLIIISITLIIISYLCEIHEVNLSKKAKLRESKEKLFFATPMGLTLYAALMPAPEWFPTNNSHWSFVPIFIFIFVAAIRGWIDPIANPLDLGSGPIKMLAMVWMG